MDAPVTHSSRGLLPFDGIRRNHPRGNYNSGNLWLTANVPTRWLSLLIRYRYVASAAAFNLPGNSLLGGGGGLAILAGMSGMFALVPFFITVALAVAPIPIAVLAMGYQP